MYHVALDRCVLDEARRQIERCTKDRQNAEDLLHWAYLRLDSHGSTTQITNAVAYLTKTAVNIRIDRARREDFLTRHSFEAASCFDSPAPLQDRVVEGRRRLERLNEGLAQLPARTREIFLLYRAEEMKQGEIAQLFDISKSAVEKHVAKAVAFVTDWMQGW